MLACSTHTHAHAPGTASLAVIHASSSTCTRAPPRLLSHTHVRSCTRVSPGHPSRSAPLCAHSPGALSVGGWAPGRHCGAPRAGGGCEGSNLVWPGLCAKSSMAPHAGGHLSPPARGARPSPALPPHHLPPGPCPHPLPRNPTAHTTPFKNWARRPPFLTQGLPCLHFGSKGQPLSVHL